MPIALAQKALVTTQSTLPPCLWCSWFLYTHSSIQCACPGVRRCCWYSPHPAVRLPLKWRVTLREHQGAGAFGHLIDIGHLNINDARIIGLGLFQESASSSSFDLASVDEHDAKLGLQLMQAVYVDYRASWISPIHPVTVSGISQLHQALVSFFKGTHISKLGVSFQKHDTLMRMVPAAPTVAFHWWARRVGSVSRTVYVRPWFSRDSSIIPSWR